MRIGRCLITILPLCVGCALPLAGQHPSQAFGQLSTAIVHEGANLARNVLKRGGPLLLDSVALRQALPAESPVAVAQAYGRGAIVTTESDAIKCERELRDCSIRGNGALVSINRVTATHDFAEATVRVTWVVNSARGNTVVWSEYEIQLARGAGGWSVVRTKETRMS